MIVWPYVLRKGHSENPSGGACAMDAVNWLVHGKHGDAPECACPVIAAYVIRGNDALPNDIRQRLIPYLHRIAGSRSAVHTEARTRVLVLGALRIFAPRALDVIGAHEHAAILRSLPDDVSWAAAEAAAAEAAEAAAATARAAAGAAAAWDDYFTVLDAALDAGPQGEPWSADVIDVGVKLYAEASGV